jgi:hypothetical protein
MCAYSASVMAKILRLFHVPPTLDSLGKNLDLEIIGNKGDRGSMWTLAPN